MNIRFITFILSVLWTEVMSVTYQGDMYNNSTNNRDICCNDTQITVIVIVSVILISLIIGCIIYCCPRFKSIRTRSLYDSVY